ncbi:MAG: lipopolysaccharide assembly protein LapA domain-containing protein [Alphaproteobacteria bacterium]
MRLPLWILVVLAAAIAVLFVLPNRQPVELTIWLMGDRVVLPLYLAIFGAVFFGFFVGWIASWFSQGKWRKRARERARRIEFLERESLRLSDQVAKLEADTAARLPAPVPASLDPPQG